MDVTTIQLTILDANSRQPTPGRVQVVDIEGNCFIAENALPVGGD